MKLRLPHKLQAALIATLASVSFTTLSTGTLTVAAGAAFLAGQQAQAEAVQASETLNTVRALSNYTGKGFTLTGMTLTTSMTEGTVPTGGDFVSPEVNVGSGGSWTLQFTLTNTADHAITLNSLDLDFIMYSSGGTTQNKGTCRSFALTLKSGDDALGSWDGVLDASGNLTTAATIMNETGSPVVTLTNPLVLQKDGAVTLKLIAARGSNTQYQNGCFLGLKDMVVNYSYELTSIPTWNGTNGHANWSDAEAWTNGIPSSATPAVFNSGAAVRTVNIDTAATALSMTIDGADYTFEGSGTLTVSGTVTVNSGAGLVLNSASAAQAMLPKVAGEGNVTLNAVLALGSGFAPTGTGELTINSTRGSGAYDLRLQGGNSATHDFSTFSKLNLAEGVVIEYDAGQTTLNNVTLQGNASFNIFDMGVSGNGIWLKGATALGSHTLAFNNTSGQSWKRKVTIEQLTGDATSRLEFLGGATGDGVGSKLYINSLQGFSGTLHLEEKNTGNAVEATVKTGTGNAVKLAGVELAGTGELLDLTAQTALNLGTVSVANNSEIKFHGAPTQPITIEKLAGNNAAGKTLLLYSEDQTTNGDAHHIVLGAAEGVNYADNLYNGTLWVTSHSNQGSSARSTVDAYVAAQDVLAATTLKLENWGSAYNNTRISLSLGTDAKVAGIVSANTGSYAGWGAYIRSGQLTVTQPNGVNDFVSTSETAYTLEITGAGTYASNAYIMGNVNLTMSGTGTQTFSGDVSRFNGAITVNDGTLKVTGSSGITAAYIDSDTGNGTLEVTNTLTLTGAASGMTSFTGTLKVGGLHVNGGYHQINGIARLGETIQVNEGGTLITGAGTYVLTDLTMQKSEVVIPTTENGYATWDGTVDFIDGYFMSSGGETFKYGDATSQVWDTDTGVVTFAGAKDYTYYYVNKSASYDAAAMGQTTVGYIVAGGATFSATGANVAGKELVLKEGATWNSSNSGTSFENTQAQALTLHGDATVNASGNVGLIASGFAVTTLNMGGHTLTVTGGNVFDLMNTTAADAGTILVDGGHVMVGHSTRTSSANLADVELAFANNGEFRVAHNSTVTVEGLSGSGSITHEGNANGTITIDADHGDYTFSGSISNGKTLVMSAASTGTQTFNLSGDTTLNTLTVNAGKLAFTGGHTITVNQANNITNNGVIEVAGTGTRLSLNNNNESNLGNVVLTNGEIYNNADNRDNITRNIATLSVNGSSKLTQRTWNTIWNIQHLNNGDEAGERTLTWVMNTDHTKPSVLKFNDSGNFSGTVVADRTSGSTNNKAYQAYVEITNQNALQYATLNLKGGDANHYMALALNASTVTLGGLSGTEHSLVYAGAAPDASPTTMPTSTGTSTLSITGGGEYDFAGKLGSGVNLSVTGHGSQTFSGDMSAFNGTLVISDSTLKFTNAGGVTATALNATNGTLDVTGTLTLNTDSQFNTFDGGSLALGGLVKTGTGGLAISGITRLDSTIQVNGGSLNVMEGTYDISGLTPTGGGTPVIPTEESGYADMSATVQFITTGEGGSFAKAESGLVFNYKGNTSNTLNNDGSVSFAGYDYTTYYLVGTAGNLNLTTEQTAHSMLQNVVLNGTAGTITVTDERSLTGSLTQADGSTLTVAGGGSLTVGSISNNAAVSIAANTSLTSTQAEMIVGGGKTFTTSGEGTLHMNILRVDGNGANVTLGAKTELTKLTTGAGTLNINGNATMEALVIGLYNAASTVNIGADATVHITGTTVSDGGGDASFMVSNYPQANTLNIEGHLISEAGISSRDGTASINVKNGGTLELRAGLNRSTLRSHDINVNVADGGTLAAAGYATDRSGQGLHVNLADGATLEGYYGTGNAITIAQALTLSGSSNTAKIEAADGKTLTLSGTISGSAFTKTGTGTLVLSGNNSHTGGTVVDAGTLKAASANALGAGTLTLNAGSTLAVESGASANVLDVTVAGNATISNAGTLVFTGTGGINVAANATITMSGAGTYDLSGMDMEAGTGTVEYTGGAEGTTLNGFAKAAGTIDFVDITAEGSSISYDGGATFLYKGANGSFDSSTGKVEVQAQDYDYSIFYVNEKQDYVSNALVDHGVTLDHIALGSGTKLNVNANIDISKIQPQTGATGYTIDVNSGGTLNISKTTDTSVITGAGTVYLSVGTEVIQGYAPTFKEDSPFTGTLVYNEGDISNHNSYVVLDNTFQGTLELRGRMNGHAMNLGGATTLRLVGDRTGNVTGLWSEGAAMTFAQNLEVTGDNQVELWSDGGTIINGTVNSGTNKAGHLSKVNNGTMTFNGAVALTEFTNPGGTVNFNAGANISTVNANGGTVNFKGNSTIDTLTANATANVAQGASLTLGAVNGAAANLVINGTVNVNGGTGNALNNVTLNAGGALGFGAGTATTIGGTATISEVITNSGSLTFNGAIIIDGLDDAELSTYVDGQDSRNGFKRYSEGGTLTVVELLGEDASMTVKEGTVVTYKGHAGTLGNDGLFTIGETSVDYTTFVVNTVTETTETYSHAKAAGGDTFTNVELAAGTSFTIDAVGADFSILESVVVRDGDTAATVGVDAPTSIGSVTTGAGLTFTGNSQSFTLGSVAGSGLLTINGPTVSIMNDNSSFAGGITVNAGQLSVTNVNALGSGPLTANEGGTIQIATNSLPNTLTVEGQGDVILLVNRSGQDVDLKAVSAANLHLVADSTHNSRFNYKGSSNLNGVEHLYFDGGQLWLNNKDMTGADKFTGDVTFNTATVYSESTNIFDHAAMRISRNAEFAGTVDVKVDTRLGWGNDQDKTLEISRELVGSGNLELESYNDSTRGTLKISGDASDYQGATTSNSHITLQVAEGGKMNLATGSNLAGAVQLDDGGKMTVSGDSTISGAINGTGSLEVKEDATLKYNRTAETTVAAELSGEGTLQYTGTGTTNFTGDLSGFTGNVDVEAGTLNIMNIAEATSLNVADVTIKNATLGVYSGETATAETASEGTLTIKGGSTLTASGENAKLNANLVMESGSTLDVSAYGGTGGLHMGCTITLTPGMTLSGSDMAGVINLGFMDAYDLYYDVNEFFIGSTQYEEITFASEQWVNAADVFSNTEFTGGKDYYVFFSGVNPGGNGGNVGTIYIVQVPEPTTSTLSLLALCALAARRRRKD